MIDTSKVKTAVNIDLTEHFKRDDYLVTRYADGDTITSMMNCFLEALEYSHDEYCDFEPAWTHEGIGAAVERNGQTLIFGPLKFFDYGKMIK
jgi:hypothetical protein